MNGIKYFRLIRGMKAITLAEKTGLSIGTIKNMEKTNIPNRISASNYCKVADVLQATIDDLIKDGYPNSGGSVPKRAPYPSRTADERNHIFIYRKEKNMSCQQLADILGLSSRERARQLCSMEMPLEKHLEKLANLENLSIEEFKRKYSQEN
mgnify:CR=1 FL=1